MCIVTDVFKHARAACVAVYCKRIEIHFTSWWMHVAARRIAGWMLDAARHIARCTPSVMTPACMFCMEAASKRTLRLRIYEAMPSWIALGV